MKKLLINLKRRTDRLEQIKLPFDYEIFENLFKKMIVEENPKHPTYPKVMLFNSELESKIVSNELIKYLGKEEFSLHKQFLNILAHMIVYQFKDDPNLNGDYSPLLYMSAFVF